MKVALITRSTLYSSFGGDSVQVLKTAKYLRRMNITADIKLAHQQIGYRQYDLLHFFNLTRPADILPHVKKAKTPFVVTPLLIDYSEFDGFHRRGFSGKLLSLLSSDDMEYAKTVARWLKGQEKIRSLYFLLRRQRASIRRILEDAAGVLPNSQQEYLQLVHRYGVARPVWIVPNGIDTDLFPGGNACPKDDKMVLCVGRIEGIKNQLSLINALQGSSFRLYLIGDAASNQAGYYRLCRKDAGSNVHFIRQLPQRQLLHYYEKAKVHVLASWFETCGLSSLEAASMQCNPVISTRGYSSDYFGDHAFYCDPASPPSIRTAIERAAQSPADIAFRDKIFSDFTWKKAAEATLQAYQKCITS